MSIEENKGMKKKASSSLFTEQVALEIETAIVERVLIDKPLTDRNEEEEALR